ncbi:hypothetical protein JMUB6875_01520 [Nocardia sp. JMUB6875]|uniref:hypothetical protein n=1 Tax=Nocardia sp. JMUB6875 TaxID=3158170 RepID=UPI0032E682D5
MTRDLPFDDASDADDNGGDAAYNIANGVARVARAGAYVTGGALIAAGGNRGGTPAIDHDSKNVGWSEVNDPKPETPSPTVTFPDLTPDSIPPHHGPAPVSPVNHSPFAHLDEVHRGTDAGFLPMSFDSIPQPDNSNTGFHGLGLPDAGTGATGLPTYGPHPGFGLPLEENTQPAGETPAEPHLPSADQQQPSLGLPGLDGTGGFHLPGAANGFQLPGASNGFHLPDMTGAHATPNPVAPNHGVADHSGAFDGVGAGGQGTGLFIGTDWSVDAHIGLDGAWFHSNLKVDVGVGQVGHQLDAFGQQLGQGISHIPANTSLPNNGGQPSLPGASTPNNMGTPFNSSGSGQNTSGAPTLPGANSTAPGANPTLPGANPTLPGASSPIASSTAPVGALGAPSPAAAQPAPLSLGTPAPAASPAPVAFTPAPVAAPAPVAPVAPVAVAPVAPVAVAPVAVAQPVTVTPLQTTIQPDAASQPIANLLSTHAGPSPLTAPAAVAPALFDHGKQPVLASGEPTAPHHPTTVADKSVPVTPAPTPAPHVSTPAKIDPVPGLTTAPTIPTKIPGLDTDITKPGSTALTTPVTPPVTGKDDVTTKPAKPGDDTGTHGGTTTPVTVPSDDTLPTHQPTVTTPAHPTPDVSVPTTVPTVPDATTHQPTVSVAPAPTTQTPVPTVHPLTTPPHVEVQTPVKPIADQFDSGAHPQPIVADTGAHALGLHDSGVLVHDSGLYTGLVPDSTFTDAHHSPMQDPGDHMLLL